MTEIWPLHMPKIQPLKEKKSIKKKVLLLFIFIIIIIIVVFCFIPLY